jgi:hypothetical protein
MNTPHLLPVREFPDRGIKWLLESVENTREFLQVFAADWVERLDFSQIEHIPTTFIPDNLRKQEADVLFKVIFKDGETEREIYIYILIEHQSTPSPSMGFRLSFYMHQLWDRQRREWVDAKVPESEWRFCPIIPIVFYTGDDEWKTPLEISALMELPRELEPFVPSHQSLFFELKKTSADALTRGNHPFSWVLRVIQKEGATQDEFTDALNFAIERLDSLPPEESGRWEMLVYYLVLLIYHRRNPTEQDVLMEQVSTQVRAHHRREEVEGMRQTIAEALIQEGKEIDKKEVLMMQLQTRFGQLPSHILQRIQSISDLDRLDTLLNRILTVNSLDEMGLN